MSRRAPRRRAAPLNRTSRRPLAAGIALATTTGVGLLCWAVLTPAPAPAERVADGAQRTTRSAPRTADAPRVPPAAVSPEPAAEAVARRTAPAADDQDTLVDEQQLADERQQARDVVEEGPQAILDALRGPEAPLASWIGGELAAAPELLCEPELVAGLSGLAADPSLGQGQRLLALELLSLSLGSDGRVVGRLGEVASGDADSDLRAAAVTSLSHLAAERDDLQAPLRAALLAGAKAAEEPWLRARALAGVHVSSASSTELAQLTPYTRDADPSVRRAALRALADAPLVGRRGVLAAIEDQLGRETDADVAAVALATALQVARGEAPVLLARLAEAPVVEREPGLRRQLADYRRLLEDGETDAARILRAQHALTQSRSVELTQ